MVAVVAVLALALPAAASACSGTVIHNAAVYRNSNGTGFIKNKAPGEPVSGPGSLQWVAGHEAFWVEVSLGGGGNGWMDNNDIESLNCSDPWL
jgi:hypothetical protein